MAPRPIYSFGASVRGPFHTRMGLPNEDAWLRASGSFGDLIVVCDGMGSRPNARLGARAACLAVKEAVSRWARVENAPLNFLTHLIEVSWRLRVFPTDPTTAATTCLFAVATTSQRWVLGGLGDGMVLVRTGNEVRSVLDLETRAFSNETTGLGLSSGVRDWTTLELPGTSKERVVVLATDGISDDLAADRYGALSDWLAGTFLFLSAAERSRQLAAELRNWPTPGHMDDKTIAVLHQTNGEGAATL